MKKQNSRSLLAALHSERGNEAISLAVIFPLLILLALISIDLARVGSARATIVKACNQGVSKASAQWPIVDMGSGALHEGNITCLPEGKDFPTGGGPGFYAKFLTNRDSGSFSKIELIAMAGAAQLICSEEDGGQQGFILPADLAASENCDEGDCEGDYAWVIPTSTEDPEETGELTLQCGMAIELFSMPLINFISSLSGNASSKPSKLWEVSFEVKREISR